MSDMKCPFCGKQMYHPVGKATWSCQNWDCLKSEGMIGNHVLWQELIDTRKALETAVDALKYANKCIKGGCVNWKTEIDKALEQITALEQKD